MKTIIAGTRDIRDKEVVFSILDKTPWKITEVVSGGAPGVDVLAIQWAKERGIEYKVYHAEWEKLGLAAGFVRNNEMEKKAEALIAIWDGESSGTRDMITKMRVAKKRVYVYNLKLQKGSLHREHSIS